MYTKTYSYSLSTDEKDLDSLIKEGDFEIKNIENIKKDKCIDCETFGILLVSKEKRPTKTDKIADEIAKNKQELEKALQLKEIANKKLKEAERNLNDLLSNTKSDKIILNAVPVMISDSKKSCLTNEKTTN